MNCGTCKFFKDVGEFDNLRKAYGYMGQCHGRAPAAMMKGVVNDMLGSESKFVVWPLVSADDFCGSYSPNDEEKARRLQILEDILTKDSLWYKIKENWKTFCRAMGSGPGPG